MGIVTAGLPTEIALSLAGLAGATAFVETGTSLGGTTRWAAGCFEVVFTIEKAEGLYQRHHETLRALGNVEPLFGDSRDLLPGVLTRLDGRKAVFWLDGHWSGGDTAGVDDECPLLGELEALRAREGDIVMIDDARLFLCAPPRPHDPGQWPTISEVLAALGTEPESYVQIVDDVIFSVPDKEPLRRCLREFAQDRSSLFWTKFAGYSAPSSGLARRILRYLKRRLRGAT